ncbi:MAG TPA: c-type cytochrome [Pyrinomonadaceae bacterium]|nr:c-type cytochrome [Pyrinomonadaceae bacterium]
MAESQEPIESLVKKESEPQRDPIASRSTSAFILICVVLLMLCTLWALYDEGFGQRPWRPVQQEFVRRYTAYLKSIRKDAGATEEQIKATPEYQELDQDAKAAADKVKGDISDIDKKVNTIQARLDAVTDPFQNQRGRIVVITFKLETANPKSFWASRYRSQLKAKKDEKVSVDLPDESGKTSRQSMDYAALEKTFNDLRDEKAKYQGQKAELLKEPSELAKKRDEYLKNHVVTLPRKNIDDLIRKNEESFDYTILGHQISVNEFGIVDRCEICHLGTREPLTITRNAMSPSGPGKKRVDDLARAFVSHPRKELLQIHNPEKFGCSACHGGNGRATTSTEKAHGLNPFWLHPLFHKENTEAGCQMCHANDRVTQGADALNLGKDLFYQRGCVGCHRMEAFDREADALSNARQQVSQLEDEIAANERQAKLDTDNSANAGDDTEVQRLLAHADSLRMQNSQVAARVDELNLQTRYLQQDQKKVGPNLKDVRLKLRKEWIPVWLENPQAFRPGTKMPTFWRFKEDGQEGSDDLKAVAAYLWQNGFDGKPPTQAQGDKNHGKDLFESRGCLACHSIGEEDQKVGGTFAANLTRVGEKSNFDYVVRWIYNPRERWAPYCPKEHRDLTPEDYAKHNKPYLFDTELHSTCPNDGAELQVQNMTVMPNLRLSEQDARDVATYLFSLSTPQTSGDVSYMDDPKLAEEGKAEIKQYGCAGCHEIKGFEEEQRIGKELTTEGATPLERLDFALLTQDAEYGREPKDAQGNALVVHKGEKEKEWYNHRGFFEHKLSDPSVYDRGKSQYLESKDRLRMPKPYLTEKWRDGLTTLLLGSMGAEGANVPAGLFYNPQDSRRQDIQNGWWVIKKYNCMGCHVLQPGQQISAYNNGAEPLTVTGSVLSSLPFYAGGQKDFLPPMLTSEGARVDPDWLMKFLKDPSLMQANEKPMTPSSSAAGPSSSPASSPAASASPAAKPAASSAGDQSNGKLLPQWGLNRNGIRPYIQVHMPTFNFSPNELRVLVRFFMAVSSQNDPYIKEPMTPLTDSEKSIARNIFVSGTPCLKCHITGEATHDAQAIAPNFLLASQRLKPDWVFRWILDPAQIAPGTAMPSGLFVKEKSTDRWVVNLPTLPPDIAGYHDDHARLLVRYMFTMTPDEQKRLLSASPAPPKPAATPAAGATTTTGRNHEPSRSREQLSKNGGSKRDRLGHHRWHHARSGSGNQVAISAGQFGSRKAQPKLVL